ncbi:uncharacterized protein LOC127155176 isoform X2 [Labeo rohita]|uniref:uncharacterized protein LOC127155176 isoform X2 n=1 Tax=Labeo rohita TaxID=84645 RepID=UPI0021E25ECD|nr:uncharacterized protein LOC127155176 isoform X2 [Labeo rohita]
MSIKVFVTWVALVTSTLISPSTQSCITQWFDHDDPNDGNGDSELLADLLAIYPEQICPNPINIEVTSVSGIPSSQIFQVFDPAIGLKCINLDQIGELCDDYKVRFTCPEKWCSTCRTPWFDQDNPDKDGDWETLSSILLAYPLQVCVQPIAIEVTTIGGIAVTPNGHFPMYDPTQGFACVNQLLNGWLWNWWCQDYKVRFTCPKSFCKPKCVTRWFDFDDPTKGGDFELLTDLQSNYPGEICPNPIGIQAQTVSGQSVYQTGNDIKISISASGFSCTTGYVTFGFPLKRPGFCPDYKVRFTCPDEWCSKCRTPWFDRDDPGGLGDYEKLSLLLIRYPLQVCPQPIAIEVTTISGIPALPPGNIFTVYDPLQGLECVNGACEDYRVRFTCPSSFCNSTCVTKWFDSDNPNTNGSDSELLSDLLSMYPGEICTNPIGIEAQTVSGEPAYTTGDVFQVYNPATGFRCVNADQTGGGLCADYKVRFSCPDTFCSSCRTSWIDKDDPDDPGDCEILTAPPQFCNRSIAIEVVTTVSESPALLTGNLFQVFDPLLGFECVNDQQGGGVCQDYKVRYTCLCKRQAVLNFTSVLTLVLP